MIDIELIIAHVLKKDRVFIITHSDDLLTHVHYTTIHHLCTQRAHGYPLAYITGTKEFFGREFFVSENTLIPRPETELMITTVIDHITKNKKDHILFCDIGTGSGIIPITLAKELKDCALTTSYAASDTSQDALKIAKKNITHHKTDDVHIYYSNLLTNSNLYTLLRDTQEHTIFITANLPYVDYDDQEKLYARKESSSLKFEPARALWSSDKGLDHYKKLITQTISLHSDLRTKKEIHSFYEIDPLQATTLCTFISNNTVFDSTTIYYDLTHRPRLIHWTLNA